MNIVEDVSEMEEFIFVVKVMESNLDRHLHIVQGVPKKTLVSVQRLLEALKRWLQMKVG